MTSSLRIELTIRLKFPFYPDNEQHNIPYQTVCFLLAVGLRLCSTSGNHVDILMFYSSEVSEIYRIFILYCGGTD